MSDKQQQKINEKEAKIAAKAALKEKKERIKKNKPKKDANAPNIFVRIGRAIKRFFKDFRGTAKKIIWPDRKTVFKNTLVVLAVTLVLGVAIWLVDFGLSKSVSAVKNGIAGLNKETTTISAEVTTDGHEGHSHDENGNEITTNGHEGHSHDAEGNEITTVASTAVGTTAAS